MSQYLLNQKIRLRRLRQHPQLRSLIQETHLHLSQLVMPLFVTAKETTALKSLPGLFQFSLPDFEKEISEYKALGIRAIMLFGIPAFKDAIGSSAWQANGIVQEAIQIVKKIDPEMLIMADLCFCEYTDHGHCGALSNKPYEIVDNDQTLVNLGKQALSLIEAGADIIAPSGMMDGMVHYLRSVFDENDASHIPILSYSIKYCSAYYASFREAVECDLHGGDRKAYQLPMGNRLEGLREAALDIEEGADMIMVKPAGPYLDIIREVKNHYPTIPLCAYQVSGEYTQIKAAAQLGWLNEIPSIIESLMSIKRAGADFIFTYFTKKIAEEKLLEK